MAENSKIEWCDHTFNPWVGCTKISPACDHCYAETWARRTGHPELWDGERRRTKTWGDPVKWSKQAVGTLPGRSVEGRRPRVFCASLADVFDNQVPTRWRDDLWFLIHGTPELDWLLLTKRPQNIRKMLPDPRTGIQEWGSGWPNVWLGTTCGDQGEYDRNWPHLRDIPAAIRFISHEPALGCLWDFDTTAGSAPDWVIVGGESGPKARMMDVEWARTTQRNCRTLGIAFFMKQMTGKAPIPEDLMVREFPRAMINH
jgi:protein gp37